MIWILFIGTMAISLLAMMMLKMAYSKYSKLPASSGLTGAEVAQRILDVNGIRDVTIHSIPGSLTDHYDPTQKTLMLSEDNYHGRSVAALGVAAHECGHAIQHQQAYAPLHWRMAAVGATSFASNMLYVIPMAGFFGHFVGLHFNYQWIATIMALCMGVVMVFQLITLPVEFDASARAKKILANLGAVAPGAETAGMNRVLNMAALTYVAAFISSLAYFLYYLLRAQSNRN
jgi:uncharacterized protein